MLAGSTLVNHQRHIAAHRLAQRDKRTEAALPQVSILGRANDADDLKVRAFRISTHSLADSNITGNIVRRTLR